MPETDHDPIADDADDAEDAAGGEEPDRDFPISSNARFSVRGKAMPLDDFIDAAMGKLADREPVEPEPQPAPQTKAVVWASRRPLSG